MIYWLQLQDSMDALHAYMAEDSWTAVSFLLLNLHLIFSGTIYSMISITSYVQIMLLIMLAGFITK